jgi:predicted RNA binding protein YcfA (HicA-like mRNA interferase family)
LRKHGFALVSQKGSHQKWRHPNGRQVIVAMHGNKPIPIGTLKSIIEGAGLTAEDFRWNKFAALGGERRDQCLERSGAAGNEFIPVDSIYHKPLMMHERRSAWLRALGRAECARWLFNLQRRVSVRRVVNW